MKLMLQMDTFKKNYTLKLQLHNFVYSYRQGVCFAFEIFRGCRFDASVRQQIWPQIWTCW